MSERFNTSGKAGQSIDWWNYDNSDDKTESSEAATKDLKARTNVDGDNEEVEKGWCIMGLYSDSDSSQEESEEEEEEEENNDRDVPVYLAQLQLDKPLPKKIREKVDFTFKDEQELLPSHPRESQDEKPHRIRLLSWNIEGLNPDNLREKTIGLCKNIIQDNPHVVLLQEVIDETLCILEEELPMYYLVASHLVTHYNLVLENRSFYFTAILLKKGFVELEEAKVFTMPTRMGRNLLYVKVTVKGEKFCFLTSHLESTKPSSETRKEQLRRAFALMKEMGSDRTVIFGGDMNLRDYEIPQLGGLPKNIHDIWECTGRREDARYTWDMLYNDNLDFSNQSFKPRCRFDRLYIKYSKPKTVVPVYFELIGFERLKSCGKFCSDHWGLLTHLDILSKVNYAKK